MQSCEAEYGVVPFENSTYGTVLDTLDFLIDREENFPDLVVCGETYLRVRHCLLGHSTIESHPETSPESNSGLSKSATPEISKSNSTSSHRERPKDLRDLRCVYSHPQAFGQSRRFLSTRLQGVRCEDVPSTSKAAEMAAADPSRRTAAIASRLAAEVHGLEVLVENIQDRDDNQTRFFILRKASATSRDQTPLAELGFALSGAEPEKWKTLVAFHIDHRHSGALANALQVYAIQGLNLTSINSRPSQVRPWHYVFLVEFEGRREADGKGQVNKALGDLDERTQGWKWLGSWIDRLST